MMVYPEKVAYKYEYEIYRHIFQIIYSGTFTFYERTVKRTMFPDWIIPGAILQFS